MCCSIGSALSQCALFGVLADQDWVDRVSHGFGYIAGSDRRFCADLGAGAKGEKPTSRLKRLLRARELAPGPAPRGIGCCVDCSLRTVATPQSKQSFGSYHDSFAVVGKLEHSVLARS